MGWILVILSGVFFLIIAVSYWFGRQSQKHNDNSENKESYSEVISPLDTFDNPENQVVKFSNDDVFDNDEKKDEENFTVGSFDDELIKQFVNIWESIPQSTRDHLDPLFEDALKVLLLLCKNASTSLFQRKFAIGYNRASRLMEQLETAGIVSSFNKDKSRDVLVKDETALKQLVSGIKKVHEGSNNHAEELSKLIGLTSVKTEINNLYNLVTVQKMREYNKMKISSISYHCVFTGNPGTGKTTVARIVADIYKDLGVIKKGHLVETDRSGLVGEYVGQTAPKTNAIIDSALDGVLFIDEAYSLSQGDQNDYGMEAISTLIKRMEDDRDRLVVILAGYKKEMEDFMNANSGLQSRFNRYIEFPDYTSEELMQIFYFIAKKNDYKLSERAAKKIFMVIEDALRKKDDKFGNARYVRNLFEKIITQQANRITSESMITNDMLAQIEEIDVVNALYPI